jgi:hypothetical protein
MIFGVYDPPGEVTDSADSDSSVSGCFCAYITTASAILHGKQAP